MISSRGDFFEVEVPFKLREEHGCEKNKRGDVE
jgi:hypothetical protein